MRVGLDCTLEDLVDFLIAIKNYDKFLRVEEMAINTATAQRQMVIRRPLNMTVAGYISAPSPSEPEAKPGEDSNQARASAAPETTRR